MTVTCRNQIKNTLILHRGRKYSCKAVCNVQLQLTIHTKDKAKGIMCNARKEKRNTSNANMRQHKILDAILFFVS